ncbi:hypothetical protein PBY51_013542 [Eleginops maclovinus]|uniref:Uncharacterized protein n=1 Tax=Eleginops maclovinus TaxID=56733 RepID=A0AAN7Y7M1_ELEMC|nr:hypothetical protein PBY51_013542 [Eleginops maclovinus]
MSVRGRREGTLMKSPTTTRLQPRVAPFSHQPGSRCSNADLGGPLILCCHGNTHATGSLLKQTGVVDE